MLNKGDASMKKKIIITIIVALAILLVPFSVRIYKDGGTKTITSLSYKVIMWRQLEGKQNTEIYLFPFNFHSLDYYES